MKKTLRLSLALMVLMVFANVNLAFGQTANMYRWIELTVQQGETINLAIAADTDNTPIRIVSGTTDVTATAGSFLPFSKTGYVAQATTMKVYGNVKEFDCSGNGAKITGVDFSNNVGMVEIYCENNALTSLVLTGCDMLTYISCNDNSLASLNVSGLTALKTLKCHNNNFSTQAIDDIYCALPQRQIADNAKIYPIGSPSSANLATVLATNSQNATDKEWKVKYDSNNVDVETAGFYACPGAGPQVNMSRWIKFSVQSQQNIKLDFVGDAADTPIKIVSGGTNIRTSIGTSWNYLRDFLAQADTMVVYGNVSKIDCGRNGAKITAIDASHNAGLKALWCRQNQITSINLRGCVALEDLTCRSNMLTTLDIKDCAALKKLYCGANNFSTQTLDSIYCALPQRQAGDNAKIYPIESADAGNSEIVVATNKQNAVAKGWSVLYASNSSEVATAGTYVCGATIVNTTVTTNAATNVAQTSATLNGSYVAGTYGLVSERGFEWRLTSATGYTAELSTSTTETFSANIRDLTPNTSYTYRAYVKVDDTKIRGEEVVFTTEPAVATEQGAVIIKKSRFGTTNPTDTVDVAVGASLTIAFTANEGYKADKVQFGTAWDSPTADIVNNQYVVSGITANDTIVIVPKMRIIPYNTFTANEVVYWVGTGSNQVVFITNWCEKDTALAWGYRWDGASVSVKTVMDAIQTADSRFKYYGSPYLDSIVYTDGNTVLKQNGGYWAYNVNEGDAANIMSQMVENGDFIEWGGAGCTKSDDFWTNTWDIAVTPVTVAPVTGVEVAQDNVIAIYPNPASDYLIIETDAIGTTIAITDLAGRTVMTTFTTEPKTTLNVSQLSAGTYVVRVGNKIAKIVKR